MIIRAIYVFKLEDSSRPSVSFLWYVSLASARDSLSHVCDAVNGSYNRPLLPHSRSVIRMLL